MWLGVGDTDLAPCDGVGSQMLVGKQPFFLAGRMCMGIFASCFFSCPVIRVHYCVLTPKICGGRNGWWCPTALDREWALVGLDCDAVW